MLASTTPASAAGLRSSGTIAATLSAKIASSRIHSPPESGKRSASTRIRSSRRIPAAALSTNGAWSDPAHRVRAGARRTSGRARSSALRPPYPALILSRDGRDQTADMRAITASVNSVVPAWPPRSGVRVPAATVSSTAVVDRPRRARVGVAGVVEDRGAGEDHRHRVGDVLALERRRRAVRRLGHRHRRAAARRRAPAAPTRRRRSSRTAAGRGRRAGRRRGSGTGSPAARRRRRETRPGERRVDQHRLVADLRDGARRPRPSPPSASPRRPGSRSTSARRRRGRRAARPRGTRTRRPRGSPSGGSSRSGGRARRRRRARATARRRRRRRPPSGRPRSGGGRRRPGSRPGIRRPVRTITLPSIASRRIRFGLPTSSAPSGVIVAALIPSPVSQHRLGGLGADARSSVARRLASERSKRTISSSIPSTAGSSTRSACSSSSWPV